MSPEVEARMLLMDCEGMGPKRIRWLLEHDDESAVVDALRRGSLPPNIGSAPPGITPVVIEKWGSKLRSTSASQLMARHASLDIEVLPPWDPRWPFSEDPEPPILVFFRGDLSLLAGRPALAVVGTRRCTTVGRTVAYEIGRSVAAAGVAVVSGLALGVDGAAHRGALDVDGPVVGVVGSGLDVVYPRGNRPLWEEVSAKGLLLSEAPAGARPERWRFPARNRMIAGLSHGVVVVESHRRGGALLTVDEAMDRDRPVFVVPGSVLSPASDGTNELLVEGAIPVRHAADVLGQLGLDASAVVGGAADDQGLSRLAAVIMAETATGPAHLDRLLLAADATIDEVLTEVQHLVGMGLVVLDGSTVSRP